MKAGAGIGSWEELRRQGLVEAAMGREVAEVGGARPCWRVGLKSARLVCL